jgi:transcriptional regulator
MRQTNGIVAFEIEINEIQAQHKLSQNRDKKNKDNIILQLKKTQSPEANAIANEMLKCQK